MLETTIRCLVRPHASNNGTVKTADTRRLLLFRTFVKIVARSSNLTNKGSIQEGYYDDVICSEDQFKLLVYLKKTNLYTTNC